MKQKTSFEKSNLATILCSSLCTHVLYLFKYGHKVSVSCIVKYRRKKRHNIKI